jgi:hypothetical protein
MKLLRRGLVRLPIVAIGAAAWLTISNHCALAGFESAAKTSVPSCHAGMPSNHSPAKQSPKSDVQCCKVLRATLLTPANNAVASGDLSFGTYDYFVVLPALADESRLSRIFGLDTGPPGTNSFAETVLQRSILVHAPPLLA